MKDTINVLPGSQVRFDYLWLGVTSKHLINRAYHVQHLLLTDQSVPVQIVETKDPLEFLLYRASGHFRQDSQEFLNKGHSLVAMNSTLQLPFRRANQKCIRTSKLIFPEGFLFMVLKT